MTSTWRQLGTAGVLLALGFACTAADQTQDEVAPNVGVATNALVACGTGNSCATGKTCCNGFCWDLQVDPLHCGSCTTTCAADQGCCAGSCYQKIIGTGAPLAAYDRVGPTCVPAQYKRYAAQGETNADNVLPDFSHAGYRGGGVRIPHAPVREILSPVSGDDRAQIQAAINRVGALAIQPDGFRGAVLLKRGTYQIGDTLEILKSGVVLRGEGQGTGGTVLLATQPAQYTLIKITGEGDATEIANTSRRITTAFVPVGATRFQVESGSFAVGNEIVVERTPNQDWIDAIRMNAAGFDRPCTAPDVPRGCSDPWDFTDFAVSHPRTVLAVQGTTLTIDIPIIDSMQERYGSGRVYKVTPTSQYVEQSGVERLRLDTTFTSAEDENHGWNAIQLSRTKNSWVRQVTALHFGASAVRVTGNSRFNTFEDVAHLDPIGTIQQLRRYSFFVAEGFGNLFQRCFARGGRHSFVTGQQVAGPNVWLDCLAINTHADEGPHHRWATGLLFDNTWSQQRQGSYPGSLHVQNRKDAGSGHGWSGAQIMFWNAEAESIISDAPPSAMNWVIGGVGAKNESTLTPGEPFGWWESHGDHVSLRSLYLHQLGDRLGSAAMLAVARTEQLTGADDRVLNQLDAWQGEGDLFPDPTCSTGIWNSNFTVCCSKSCGTCGGSGCAGRDGATDSCCTGTIDASRRSCLEYGPPCLMPDPDCHRGIANGNVCCKDSCGTCGGNGCDGRDGGAAGCCVPDIQAAWRSCADFPPPCVLSDPRCEEGDPSGSNGCCDWRCRQCGGEGCGGDPLGADSCCVTDIVENGNSCTTSEPPCVLSDPGCLTGIRLGSVCCDAACGRCQSAGGCSLLPGGANNCCAGTITTAARSCALHMPPCVIP